MHDGWTIGGTRRAWHESTPGVQTGPQFLQVEPEDGAYMRLPDFRQEPGAWPSLWRQGWDDSSDEWERHPLGWRLRLPYLAYCLVCSYVLISLLIWRAAAGAAREGEMLLQWDERCLGEGAVIVIGVVMAAETLTATWLLGTAALQSGWDVFDIVVALLVVSSIALSAQSNHEVPPASALFLACRFVLRAGWTRYLRRSMEELQVDFGALPECYPIHPDP